MAINLDSLEEVAERIKFLSAGDLEKDEELDELNKLNKVAAKLRAKSVAAKEQEAAQAEISAKREAETQDRINKAVAEAVKKEAAKSRRLPDYTEGGPYQSQFSDEAKYDNLDAADLSLVIDFQKKLSVKTDGVMPMPGPEAYKALSRRIAALKESDATQGKTEKERAERLAGIRYVKSAFKAATGIEPDTATVDQAIKAATDPMYTAGSGIGSDWVGTAYSTEIWNVIRANTMVLANIPSDVIPDGYSNKTWPLESTDMTWYNVAEATASDGTLKVPAATVTASQIATSSKNITVSKLGARGLYTGELTEDSLITFASQLRTQLEISGREMLESLVIDGDVETSANKNINLIDGTPTAGTYWLSFDGFRKLALVTTTANSRSAGGVLSIDDFLATMQLMGTAGLAGADPSKVGFIVDGNTYYALARLAEVKTKDVNSAATVEKGFVSNAYGVPVIPSWQMQKNSAKRMANTSGKISGTDSNNTTGSILSVRWDQWKQVYKRRMTMEVTRIANADSYELVALCRFGLGYRDGEASAITYNVGV